MSDEIGLGPELSAEGLSMLLDRGGLDIGRPFVLFNKTKVNSCREAEIPPDILAAIGEPSDPIRREFATPDRLSRYSLSRQQSARFENGQPVLMRTGVFGGRKESKRGGQYLDNREQDVKCALEVTVYRVIEKLHYLMPIRDRIESTSPKVRRDFAIQALLDNWPEYDTKHTTEKSRRKHINTLLKRGNSTGSWKKFYGVPSLSSWIERWADSFKKCSKEQINREIDFQISLVVSLLTCKVRATSFQSRLRSVINKIFNRKKENQDDRKFLSGLEPSQHRLLAHVLSAAFAGDINPSDLFFNLESGRDNFEAMRVIGRFSRGLSAAFTAEHMPPLMAALKILLEWTENPWDENSPEFAAKTVWVKVMLSVMPCRDWYIFLYHINKNTRRGDIFVVQRRMEPIGPMGSIP